MTTKSILSCTAALLGLGACIVPPSMFERASWGPADTWQDQGRYRPAPTGAAPSAEQGFASPAPGELPPGVEPTTAEAPATVASEPPLYAWDGGVVDGAPQGRVAAQEGAPRGLEAPPAGRMHIIELYQQVLDERDSLSEEVELLRKNLEQTSLALEAESKESDELGARVATLEASHRELMNDNQAIAARLVQAQIRRLEAEKLLLETRIEVERAKAEEAALAAATQSRVAGQKPKPPKKSESEGEKHE